jgi:hypothetical protein
MSRQYFNAKNMLEKFKQHQVSEESMKLIKGGVSPEEYCATNAMIMRSCFNAGDTACMAAAGAAWQAYCNS